MPFRILKGTSSDGEDLLALLPRLGAFPRPAHRSLEEISRVDERSLRQWIDGSAEDCHVFIARGDSDALLGFALTRLRPDTLNGEPSAHLETLVVAEGAEGMGVGSALIASSEESARKNGARSMTLHVFETNERARQLYERKGYEAEWLRYIKPLRPAD